MCVFGVLLWFDVNVFCVILLLIVILYILWNMVMRFLIDNCIVLGEFNVILIGLVFFKKLLSILFGVLFIML